MTRGVTQTRSQGLRCTRTGSTSSTERSSDPHLREMSCKCLGDLELLPLERDYFWELLKMRDNGPDKRILKSMFWEIPRFLLTMSDKGSRICISLRKVLTRDWDSTNLRLEMKPFSFWKLSSEVPFTIDMLKQHIRMRSRWNVYCKQVTLIKTRTKDLSFWTLWTRISPRMTSKSTLQTDSEKSRRSRSCKISRL